MKGGLKNYFKGKVNISADEQFVNKVFLGKGETACRWLSSMAKSKGGSQ